ncbi:Pc-esterase domain-containing protein 1a-like [Plakobranchus ocellatus]|uniref:Pc-esterase domain-containing protein 1a-like n=1 Tax=Plakobranchus ocellatus TaxID=259542 RepID=A0AAV4E1X1_9GAST|nr:Pc-esterase domain-containing protein 1a-like [Plakobranchus ocellatus]
MEVFDTKDIAEVLKNRFIVIIGDSIQRTIYKDLVLMLQENRPLSKTELKCKGEFSFLGDELIEGGKKSKMTNGISYKEVRQYQTDVHLVRFYFMTRCYNSYLESILKDLKEGPSLDVLIMNSCLWDITRYGRDSIKDYKDNLQKLFPRFLQCLPVECLVIWTTTLPISSSARGGFLVPEIEFMSSTLRLDILESNFYAKMLAADHGFDVLDLHFYLRHYLHWRVDDGIHWDMAAHRYITNLLLSHICDAWNIPMPAKARATFCSYGSAAGVRKRSNYDSSVHAPSNYYNRFNTANIPGFENYFSNYHNSQRNWTSQFENQNSWNENTTFGNSWNNLWNGPCQQQTALWNGPNPNDIHKFSQNNLRILSNMSASIQTTINSCQQVFNQIQNFHWQSYQQEQYQSVVPHKRHLKKQGNPYSRQRRY